LAKIHRSIPVIDNSFAQLVPPNYYLETVKYRGRRRRCLSVCLSHVGAITTITKARKRKREEKKTREHEWRALLPLLLLRILPQSRAAGEMAAAPITTTTTTTTTTTPNSTPTRTRRLGMQSGGDV
jgi:hypothetical protein